MRTLGTANGILVQDSDTVETSETLPPPPSEVFPDSDSPESDVYDVEPVTLRCAESWATSYGWEE